MIHISFSQGCHEGLGCGDEDDDEDDMRFKRSESARLLASLVSCRAAVHPYDPGHSSQDTSGCAIAELTETRPAVINARARVTTVRTIRKAGFPYA
ncbi:hypothetical protein [Bordetella sp. LUAb4]|uniref:hypothetical protein n=1 Tax=Bordetella sp. LUAb4 TaxID=2843195 RepID=UPI001E3CF2BC|nr:hypothetical protein [Bordetella sp. LUAb4]